MNKLEFLQCIFRCESLDKTLDSYLPFIDDALFTIKERERRILQKRFNGMTQKEVGQSEGISSNRISQIEHKVIRMMRHPSRIKILKGEMTIKSFFISKEERIELLIKAQDFKNILISDLPLSVRAYNCMSQNNIKTVSDLMLTTEKKLLETRNFGEKSLNEIKNILKHMSIRLKHEINIQKP